LSTSTDPAARPLDAPHAREPLDAQARADALAVGAPRVPRKAVILAVLVAAVLALGGTAVERLASSAGLNPTPVATTGPGNALSAPLGAFMGLARLPGTPAPALRLTDPTGRVVTLSSLRGRVVVLSFFDADCQDACPVLAREIAQADVRLGREAGRVAFVTVNADPLALRAARTARVVTATGLSALGNWRFLTGPLGTIDPVWRHYGVAISVYPSTGTVVHNNVMYFIDPAGRLRLRTAPVVNESHLGVFSLGASSVARSALGIATYARELLGAVR